MKKTILTITYCAILIFLLSITICSAEGPYVSGNLGISIPNDSDASDPTGTVTLESDNALALGAALGYNFGNIRLEGEFAFLENDLDKASIAGTGSINISGDTSSTTLLFNGYYDFKNESNFISFLSAGVGTSKVEVSTITVTGYGTVTSSSDDTVFAYQVGAGVGYKIIKKVIFDVKYRYFATSDLNFDGVEAEYSSHIICTGLRISF